MKFAYLIEPPFNFRDAAGTVQGHDVEIAQYVLEQLGERFEPFETEFSQLLPGLADGRWQMTTGLFATDERCSQALFTRPIWALPDGLLVSEGNPKNLTGYRSVAVAQDAVLAVIRDQVQHRAGQSAGVSEDRTLVFETYADAAAAVRDGRADAYASVARAHVGFVDQNPDWPVEVIKVPSTERSPEPGAFGLPLGEDALLAHVNVILGDFLGGPRHRNIAARHGFNDAEVAFVAG